MKGVSIALLLLLVVAAFSRSPCLKSSTLRAAQFFSLESTPPSSSSLLSVRLVFFPAHPEALEQQFRLNSNPSSPSFALHPDPCPFVRPTEAALSLAAHFAALHGLHVVSQSRCFDAWTLRGTVKQLEEAFQCRLLRYRSKVRPSVVVVAAEKSVTVPHYLEPHVSVVDGLHFPTVLPKALPKMIASSYAIATPTNLKALYGIGSRAAWPNSTRASQGVAGWEHQSFSVGDLTDFQKHYGIPEQGIRKIFGRNTDIPHMESNLDTQTITSMGQGVPTDFFLNSGFSFDVLDWAYSIANETNPALVWSLSYGEDLTMKTPAYAQATNRVFQQLALRGISILVASGDTGAKSRQSLGFASEFPAVLPAVTAVGATVLNENLTETSCVDCSFGWCSGGGFSVPAYFPNSSAPWQLAAVQHYLSTASNLPPVKEWATMVGGVGFPDLAAVGSNHDIYFYRIRMGVAGTSASCPTAAGMISLLNDARMRAGKTSLGFLNQILYGNPSLFHDITLGNTGWPASKGWDATTGLGTMQNFDAFVKLALQLP